jgi:hypothetical protein
MHDYEPFKLDFQPVNLTLLNPGPKNGKNRISRREDIAINFNPIPAFQFADNFINNGSIDSFRVIPAV